MVRIMRWILVPKSSSVEFWKVMNFKAVLHSLGILFDHGLLEGSGIIGPRETELQERASLFRP